jgi:arylsulfatase A-like enzyme
MSYGTVPEKELLIEEHEDTSFAQASLPTGGNNRSKLPKSPLRIGGALLVSAAFVGLVFVIATQTRPYNGPFKDTLQLDGKTSPNFVFILADDLGWNSIGYQDYDMSFATPILTSLAKKGMIMSNYYAQEVCTPSRASLLTGRYPLSLGMQYGVVSLTSPWGLDLSEQTIAEVLNDAGYKSHIVGKWHLGHHSPRYLPTARGFDSFTGYLDGNNYYNSKHSPVMSVFRDFMQSTAECYSPYREANVHNYSTHLYREKAVDIIENHDQTSPLFLYLPFQAVHDPFNDIVDQRMVAGNLVSPEIFQLVEDNVQGEKRKQVAYALNLLDNAVGHIVDALERTGMMDNTYLIFASDNGGCFAAGGKNGPLRGTKGSLFEGATKVDAFVYSPLLGDAAGSMYDNLFHVSDWFPTMVSMSGADFTERMKYKLDGVSHFEAMMDKAADADAPREYMLYNSYYNVRTQNFDMWKTGILAIRDSRYKLIHYYDNTMYGGWYSPSDVLGDDDEMDSQECSPMDKNAQSGSFTYGLFDLQNDPYETKNLYSDQSAEIEAVKKALYSKLDEHHANARVGLATAVTRSKTAEKVWKEAGNNVVPYVDVDQENVRDQYVFSTSYPQLCDSDSSSASS